jgi:hypothetical protein
MMQAGTAPTLTIKKVTVAPLCSHEEARKRFGGRLLDDSHVKVRLSENAQIVTPEGETKFVFLKNVLPEEIVDLGWRTLRTLKFQGAEHSRRTALNYKGSLGGEVLFGWIDFAKRGRGIVPILTSQTREMWPQFRMLWYVLYFIQYWFHKYLPDVAKAQLAKAEAAQGSLVEALLDRQTWNVSETDTVREEVRQCFLKLEREQPEEYWNMVYHVLLKEHPEYLEQLHQAMELEQKAGIRVYPQLGLKDGELMAGYSIPGTMFSTVTVNRTALFRSHEDGNNLPGGLACLTAFGDFAGGDLCFPRFGVSCPIEPGDLLIGDNNLEQHGNIGPLSGERISIVAYMRDDFAK